MKCPRADDWDLLAMEVLEGERAEGMLEHARTCPTCREQFRAARRAHIDRVRMYEAFDHDHDELREQLMAALPDELPRRTGAIRLVRGWARLGDIVMSMNKTGGRRAAAVLAPAACIVIAVVVLLSLQNGVAFAAVLERIRQAHTMVCDIVVTARTEFSEPAKEMERTQQEEGATPVPTEQTTRGTLSMYSDGTTVAWRWDRTDPPSTVWTFPGHSVNIDADGKRTVIRFAGRLNPYERCETPEWWLNRLLKLTEAPDRELGTQMLDGRKVVGFEIAGWKLGYGVRPTPGVDATTAPTAIVRLWVDASTRLPVRMQVADVMAMRMPGIVSMKVSQTWEHIEWDVPLDPQSFQPPPPVAGAPVEELELDVNGPEEALLNGLRAYAAASQRFTGGRSVELPPEMLELEKKLRGDQRMALVGIEGFREFLHGYPKDLDASAVLRLSVIAPNVCRGKVIAARASGNADAIARAEEEAKRFLEELTTDVAQKMVPATLFYSHLLREDREPEYFGATVKPGDSDAVLMRWKLDDSHWRVIYGDLRAETLPMDKQPKGGVSLDSQSVPPPAPAAGQPFEVEEEGLDILAPTEEALLDGLRAYAAEIERIKTLFGERYADLPQLMEQESPDDDPEAALARAALGGILEVLGHGYPEQLDMSCLFKLSIVSPSLERAREFAARARGDAEALARWADEREAAAGNAEAAARLAEKREAARKEHEKFSRSVSAMLIFYRQLLVEDREPDYFGATVKPGDADAVLMRWKLEGGSTRVVYGDLRVETLSGSE